ncbi:hypothetical protein ACH9L7_11995 [Haloferax sp. S1W]|uniref:DUF7856 family protein n=1 Tax=Haloferax sp. S1W TaxID=3377110 RepID=UPI0037C88C99
MRVRLPDETTVRGRGIDLSDFDIDADTVVAAVRNPAFDGDGLCIDCPEPGPGHDRLAVIPVPNFSHTPVLAAVGRSRGLTTPVDDEIDRIEARLADIAADTDAGDAAESLRAARRRLAEAGDDEARLRERVATLRGRLNAHRESDDEEAASAVKSDLVEATTTLSEVETERIAAEQRLSALERDARSARDTREERLRLRDALDNRRREARRSLAEVLRAEFDDAVRELAEWVDDSGTPQPESVVSALAAVTLAEFRAPVVLTTRIFPDAQTATRELDVPVIRV